MLKLLLYFSFFLCLSASLSAYGQQTNRDLANVRIDALSDNQISQIISQAGLSNASSDEILKFASLNNLPTTELKKLEVRLQSLRGRSPSSTDSVTYNRRVINADSNFRRTPVDTLRRKIFGADLFNATNLTFEPNLRLATPTNYILGPDDQLNISVFGRSVANWRLSVSPDGTINIPAVGVIGVAGKTIEQATSVIRGRLNQNNYSIGNGTNLNITLGNIRSIKVLLVGEIVKPGTYTLPSLATIFNALYASGGPNNNGSFRQIELIRNNRIVRRLDVYDFLLNGSQADNIGLKDQDIIRVPTYKVRVEMTGEIKRPALYEVLSGETLADVIRFAGNFNDEAYTSKLRAVQIEGQERQLIDIEEQDFKNYIPLRGDKFIVDRILDRYKNRVTINGAILRPGMYALEKNLTLAQLIKKASGLKEGAFASRGFIQRVKADNTTELVPFNTVGIVNGSSADIQLQREDVITIPSILDLRDEHQISITGQVRKPGRYPYAENMTVEDLVIIAGGFTEQASAKRISVARRVSDARPDMENSPVAQVAVIDINENLSVSNANFKLQPFDIISVYTSPGFEKQRMVSIEGEVLYPGTYVIESNNERIADIIKRAGGLTAAANVEGGTLIRPIKNPDDSDNSSQANSQQPLEDLKEATQSEDKDANSLSNSETEKLKDQTEFVGINLDKILANPKSITNIIVENGDVLRVPKEQNVIHVNGEVLHSSAVVYAKSKTLKQYVLNAGGYSSTALKRKAYVVYPNGSIEGSHNFLFFHNSPKVKAGSTIFVPKKPERKGMTTGELVGIGGTLVSLAAILVSVLK